MLARGACTHMAEVVGGNGGDSRGGIAVFVDPKKNKFATINDALFGNKYIAVARSACVCTLYT